MKTNGPSLPLPRLLPERPLPPYSYVTRLWPHPLRDPQGHSYSSHAPPIADFRAEAWRDCEAYLWGIDLFNNGYYWEAHESWEAVWHAAGRRGTSADFCKALIKLAAAGVKAREGLSNGVLRHAIRCQQLLEAVSLQRDDAQRSFMGLSLPELRSFAQELIDNPSAIVNTNNASVVIVMPFVLRVAAD